MMARSSIRRANDERILRRRMALPYYFWARGNPRWMGIYRNTGKPCSCPLCSRDRKWIGPSPQERRQIQFMEHVR